jgi:hypothetical protein
MTLEYTRGNLQFTWVEGAKFIEMYERTDEGVGDRLGFVELEIDGEAVPFEQGAFEEHCKRVLAEMANARIVEPGTYDIQRILGGNLLHSMEGLGHHTTVGIIGMVWGEIPTTLEDPGSDETEWKLHMGGEHWVIVKKVS